MRGENWPINFTTACFTGFRLEAFPKMWEFAPNRNRGTLPTGVVTVADFYELFGSPFLDCTFIGFIHRAYVSRKPSYKVSFLYFSSFMI